MAEDFYSKKAIGERIRARLRPSTQPSGSTVDKLKEAALRRRLPVR